MRAILLDVFPDRGLEARLTAALAIARLFGGRLTCVQATPFNAYIVGDPFGGVYALPAVMEQVRSDEEAHRSRVEGWLGKEGVTWEWIQRDGIPEQVLLRESTLADLIVTRLPSEGGDRFDTAAYLSIHARGPVLAVPPSAMDFDPEGAAVVAWNGSPEAAHALRLALPLLARAAAVHIVQITEDDCDFPTNEALSYLALHGIRADLADYPRAGHSLAGSLVEAATEADARYIVMGAYGHTRFSEAVLGGMTRDLLRASPIPLLLAH